MSKAEEKAVEYQIKTHGPNVMGGASVLSEEEYMRLNMNLDFKNGYEQAEKDTLDRICKWLEEHATYIHPRKGIKTCFINLNALREAMEGEL